VGTKRLKRELRTLAEHQDELDRAHRRLARHTEVIAVALRSPDLTDCDDAIAGLHELNALLESRSFPRVDPPAGQEHFGASR